MNNDGSEDEECDDGNLADGDGCSPCRRGRSRRSSHLTFSRVNLGGVVSTSATPPG
ncbi:MAG: hypothetical protein OER77_03805 [Myxococcales bacterium]|nr:hypothetical protein [Myxococcales bacterium]